eukprot:TRINITY_DN258_c0_g2_i10.p1 TRINITY_DN258_c0_g2~~TRINITY_DN258_c0_g2_i10.p1  ORF type:complete len:151 (-),score=30.70 TRINITY_DN258_c0_g2_i10:11-463(-)
MQPKTTSPLLLLLVLSCLLVLVFGESSPQKEFNIRPGFPEVVELEYKGLKCSFTYKCTGGSSEKWMITVEEDGNQVICNIGRPNPPSYILFTHFTAQLTSPSQKGVQEVEVWDNSGLVLENDQYTKKSDTVTSSSGWGGNLTLITMTTTK